MFFQAGAKLAKNTFSMLMEETANFLEFFLFPEKNARFAGSLRRFHLTYIISQGIKVNVDDPPYVSSGIAVKILESGEIGVTSAKVASKCSYLSRVIRPSLPEVYPNS